MRTSSIARGIRTGLVPLRLAATVLFVFAVLPLTSSQAESPAPIRALLVTGGCCHDYPRQTEILTRMLPLGVEVQWDVRRYGSERDIKAEIYSQPDWASRYDVVVHNECFGGVTDGAFVRGIVDAHVKHQLPALMIHCSMHAYREAPTADLWRGLIGLTSRRHERGKRPLEVVPRQSDHAIVAALQGKAWQTPNGELYVIENVGPEIEVLATAYSTEEQRDMPVVWTNRYEGVRVFGTTLGHHNETMEDPVWLETVARGLLWACQRPMDQLQAAAATETDSQ